MTPEQIEQLAIVMHTLQRMGFTKDQVKKSADAWWTAKGLK